MNRLLITMRLLSVALLPCAAQPSPAQAEPTVQVLIAQLKNRDPEKRAKAAGALGDLGFRAATAVEPLIRSLKDRDADVRFFAAWALGHIAAKPEKTVPALLRAMDDTDYDTYMQSSLSIAGGFPGWNMLALPKWRAWLQGQDPKRRSLALRDIAELQVGARLALPLLIAGASGSDAHNRWMAVRAIQAAGEWTPLVEFTLKSVVQHDTDLFANQAAMEALGKLAPPTPALLSLLAENFLPDPHFKNSNAAYFSALAFVRLWEKAAPQWNGWSQTERETAREQAKVAQIALKINRQVYGQPARVDAALAVLER